MEPSVPKIAPSIQITLSGCFYWKLLFHYSSTCNGTVTRLFRHKTIERFSWDTFQRRAKEALKSKPHTDSGSYVFRSATVDDKYDEVNHFLSTVVTKKTDFYREAAAEAEWKYEIGSNSNLALYQLYFTGPGISLVCDAQCSFHGQEERVEISVELEARQFVSNIKVVYGSSQLEKPHDCVKYPNNRDPDIIGRYNNQPGDSAKHVWLVPEYTMLVKDACTGFDAIMDPNGEIETANNAQGGKHVDLNGGGSGRRLFLVPIKDPTDTCKVVAVGLSGKNSLAVESYFNQISNTLTFSSTGSYLVSKTTAVENL